MNKEITSAPWSVLSQKTDKGQSILTTDCRTRSYRYIGYINDRADADRIVSCVNSMAGIEDTQKHRDTWEAVKMLRLDEYHTLKASFNQLVDIASGLIYRLSWSNTFISNENVLKNNQESLKRANDFIDSISKTEEEL